MNLMNACVDIGNTSTKIGFFRNHELLKIVSLAYEDVAACINEQQVEQVIISSVSKPVEPIISQIRKEIYVLDFDYSTKIPFNINYDGKIGLDRIAGIMAARHLYSDENVLIIDAGTCLTFDLKGKNGEYKGGRISPGFQMRLKAMHHFTEKLPAVSVVNNNKEFFSFLGNGTESAMRSGVYFGIKDEVDGLISKLDQKFSTLKVLICGGDAKIFDYQGKEHIFVIPELVLIGLNSILFYNAKNIR